jgi:hypothetical protein
MPEIIKLIAVAAAVTVLIWLWYAERRSWELLPVCTRNVGIDIPKVLPCREAWE